MTKFICVSGKAQNGKDTTSAIINQKLTELGYKTIIVHYADLVKYICKTFFNWDGNKDEKGRTLLQYVGTDVVRKSKPDYWVDFIIDMVDFFHENWDYVIVSDTRFPNEIQKIKDHGYQVIHIKVVRPNFESPLTEEQQKHLSEIALDNIQPDLTLYNSTLDELNTEVTNFCKNIKEFF